MKVELSEQDISNIIDLCKFAKWKLREHYDGEYDRVPQLLYFGELKDEWDEGKATSDENFRLIDELLERFEELQ